MEKLNPKVLIVDDEAINRKILRKYLENDYEIIEAINGDEAIAKIQEFGLGITLILLDLIMPKKNGFDVLEYLNTSGYIQAIPVVVITVEDNFESEIKSFDYGVSDFITKPFYPQIVRKRVQNIIELFNTQKNLRRLLEEQLIETMSFAESMSDEQNK